MLLEKMSDQQLVVSYLGGKELAIETLITRHKDRIYAYLLSKVKDRALAEDLFQDTFIKVIQTLKRGKYNEEGKFLPWVYRIAHNLIIDHFRKNSKMQMIETQKGGGEDSEYNFMDSIADGEMLVDQNLSFIQMRSDIKALIKALPEDQREVLVMRHYYDMSFKEIANMTNVSTNTALGRMRYALINMRKMVEEKNMNFYQA